MITLIHPSRGRAVKAFETAKKWIEQAGTDIEYILSIDDDDPQKKAYQAWYWDLAHWKQDWRIKNKEIVSGDNKSVVEATNKACREATGDILIYLSDDFDCFQGWGIAVENEFKKHGPLTLLKVDDCFQPFHVMVLTIPMMTMGLYKKLGYFWHPSYRSMFVDEDLYWTCRKLEVIRNAEHLKFPHLHKKYGDDQTYRNSASNWDSGKAAFKLRQGLGFPV